MGALQPWVELSAARGDATGTINHGLQIVRRILNLAAAEWVDEQGLTWLQAAPKINCFPIRQRRQPYPLSWEEQARLFGDYPTTWQRWHCLPSTRAAGTGNSAIALGVGGRGAAARHLGVHHPGHGQKRRGAAGRPEPVATRH